MPKRKVGDGGMLNVKNPLSLAKKKVPVERQVEALKTPDPDPVSNALLGNDVGLDRSADDTAAEPEFDLFVGTDFGVLKGVGFGGDLPISKSIFRDAVLKKRTPGIVSLAWATGEEEEQTEKELLVTFVDHVVKTYSTKLRCFTRQMELELENADSRIAGLCSHDSGNFVFGLEDGTLAKYNLRDSEIVYKVNTGSDIRKLRQCPSSKGLYATGGKESDLKVWNFSSEKPDKPLFKAKNLPHDNLDLRVPVWIQDLAFLPRTTEVLAVGTRYGQLRLYDVRANERPVTNLQSFDHPIMSLSATMNDRQVIVGTAKGEAGLFDLRNSKNEKLLLKFYGFAGSIRCMEACSEKPYVVSCGLDRHLYVHKFSQRSPVKKLYMKQQMNCIALSKSFIEDIEKRENQDASCKTMNSKDVEGDWVNIPEDVLMTESSFKSSKKKKTSKTHS